MTDFFQNDDSGIQVDKDTLNGIESENYEDADSSTGSQNEYTLYEEDEIDFGLDNESADSEDYQNVDNPADFPNEDPSAESPKKEHSEEVSAEEVRPVEDVFMDEQPKQDFPDNDSWGKGPAEKSINDDEHYESQIDSGNSSGFNEQKKRSYSDSFLLFYGTTQGYSHIKAGLECEDSGEIKGEPGEYKMFAVADGHGDSNCPRSKYGSETACEVAVKKLIEFYENIKTNRWEDHILSSEPRVREKTVRQLVVSIVSEWSQIVNEHFQKNPLTPKERADCSRYIDRYDKGQRIEHIYGTTLIAGLLTDRYLLLLQQGDGKCVVFDNNGIASEPIPWDPRCNDNITTSMCDEDVVQGFRHCEIDIRANPIIACVAGSDGVDDSFPNSKIMHAYYRQIFSDAAQKGGAQSLNDYFVDNLAEFSKSGRPGYGAGSQDDVTIVGFANFELLKQFKDKFALDNEIVLAEMELDRISARLASKNGMGKYDALKEAQQKSGNALKEARQRYEAKVKDLQEFRSEYDKMTRHDSAMNSMVRTFYKKYFSFDEGAEYRKKDDELVREIEEAKVYVQRANEAFEKSKKEFVGFDSSKNELERRKQDVEDKLRRLRQRRQ